MTLALDASAPISSATERSDIEVREGAALDAWLHGINQQEFATGHPSSSFAWLRVLRDGLGHQPFLLEANHAGSVQGRLPLAFVKSALFGRFLVSLPYVNTSGVQADTPEARTALIDEAVRLADRLDVKYLELRHETELQHACLTETRCSKVLMRLSLPVTSEQLLNGFKSKLRSQIRSGEKHGFEVQWGRHSLLHEFYAVFCQNMRDLGTPVFPRKLFASILEAFGDAAELCVLKLGQRPAAAALLLHGHNTTEVPSASSLRQFNSLNANMVMYWHLLKRAVDRGQQVFDFGRSTLDSNTYRFKKQWGAEASPSVWQYYVRRGAIGDIRPENAKFRLAIRAWQKLPLWLANRIGPLIVRGIP